MDKVRINKKDRPVCFGWNALAEYERLSGKSLLKFVDAEGLSIGNTLQLVYVGLLYGAKKDKQEVTFTIEDVGNWLDDSPEVIGEVITIFTNSMPDVGKKK